ncbi:MAG: protein arginine N-methyltransferase 1 [Candidatus Peregrinibacteria bacterium Greene1014_49]|nr:MAG: protein arginine N-methyltransferase 1 [Candidatus Peregrinibacteria bacterium Greene1014_49]
MSLIEYQRTILADPIRNRAFSDALKKLIIPGKTTVADIGAGTGYLSFLARKLGAKECHLYEVSELSDISRALAKETSITGCHFIHKHSTEVKNPPKVDLVISETFGNFALEESIIGNLNDAKRFLKPGGNIMPMNLKQFIAPVITDRIQKSIDTWSGIEGNFQWNAAREVAMNNMYVKDIRPEDFLKDGTKEWDHIDFTKHNKEIRHASLQWNADQIANHQSPIVNGFALWWSSDLAAGITLSTSPFEKPTHWQQIYLPLLETVSLKANETLELTLDVDSRYDVRINVAWKTTVKDKQGKIVKAISQDMRRGFLS